MTKQKPLEQVINENQQLNKDIEELIKKCCEQAEKTSKALQAATKLVRGE